MEADRVVVASPNTLDHSARSRLVVIITLVCSTLSYRIGSITI